MNPIKKFFVWAWALVSVVVIAFCIYGSGKTVAERQVYLDIPEKSFLKPWPWPTDVAFTTTSIEVGTGDEHRKGPLILLQAGDERIAVKSATFKITKYIYRSADADLRYSLELGYPVTVYSGVDDPKRYFAGQLMFCGIFAVASLISLGIAIYILKRTFKASGPQVAEAVS